MNTVLNTKQYTAGNLARRLAEKNAAGEVCGVFSHAVYCTFGEEILLFHGKEWGEVPFGIALPDIVAFRKAIPTAVGDVAAFTDGGLRIGNFFLPLTLTAPTREASAQLVLPSAKRIQAVETYVLANGSQSGILEYIANNRAHAAETVQALCAGMHAGDRERASAAAVRLIGLGRGLTPSGDDYLAGFFTLLAAAKETGLPIPPCRDECAAAVLRSLDRTSRISGAYLGNALRGEYFTVYDRAVRALLSADDFMPHCEFVLQMGASSGTDTLLGALAAAKML